MKTWSAILYSLLFFAAASILTNCTKKVKGECDDVVCTQESRLFTISTIDEKNNPIIPQTIQVINMLTGAVVKNYTQNIGNNFVILGDEDKNLLPINNGNQLFRVIAKKDGIVTDSTEILFSRDCCHINLLSGVSFFIVHQ